MSNHELEKRAAVGIGPLLEGLRKALAHDLRNPLGTVANYATILEYHDQAKPEEVRAFATRIRTSVERVSAMLTQITEALALATRKPNGRVADPAAILRALLPERGLQGHGPPAEIQPRLCAGLDADLLRYCWRAFLAVHVHAAPASDLDVSWGEESDELILDLWLTKERDASSIERMDASSYAPQPTEPEAQDAHFALNLAACTVAARGGSLEILGRAGIATQLRLRLPSPR